MKKDWFKNLLRWWGDAGWTSFGLAIIFFVLHLRKNTENYLYLSIALFIVSIIQLIIKYKNKRIHNK